MEFIRYEPKKKQELKPIFDPEAKCVLQRGFAIIDRNARIQKLGTAGLGPCIGIVLYDQTNQVLSVSHFDAMTELENSVAILFDWMRHAGAVERKAIKATLTGGDELSKELRERLTKKLHEFGTGEIIDLNPDSHRDIGPRKFVVSVLDGVIHENVMPAYPEEPTIRTVRLSRMQSPIPTSLDLEYIDVKGKVQGI